MPRRSEAQMFDRTISQLLAKRKLYSEGLSKIEGIFTKYGIHVNGATPAAATTKHIAKPTTHIPTRRGRRSFAQTGDEFVLSLLKGGKALATAEINRAWKKAGRGGAADNNLGKLTKEKKIKRTPVKDGIGSNYSLV